MSVRANIPRRELLTLLVYLEAGSHKDAAYRLAVSESACRQRVSSLLTRLGATNAAQAAWWLRRDLEREQASAPSQLVSQTDEARLQESSVRTSEQGWEVGR